MPIFFKRACSRLWRFEQNIAVTTNRASVQSLFLAGSQVKELNLAVHLHALAEELRCIFGLVATHCNILQAELSHISFSKHNSLRYFIFGPRGFVAGQGYGHWQAGRSHWTDRQASSLRA